MSAYMLGSLSNRDYDDYFKQHMNRLDHRADSFRTMLATGDDTVFCDDPYCREYRRPSSSTNIRQTRRPSRRRTASVSTTNPRHERPRRMPSREDFYSTEEQQDEDWYYYRRPRPRPRTRSFGDDIHYGNISDNSNSAEDDEEDEESMNELELLAQENARRNVLVVVDEPVNNNDEEPQSVESVPDLVVQQLPEQAEVPPQQSSLADNRQPKPPSVENDQQQQQPQPNSNTTTPTMSTTSSTSTPPKKKKKWPFSIFARRDQSPVGPSTPSPANSASPLGRFHAVKSIGLLGDVLDAQQQDQLVRQLYDNDTRGTPQQQQQYQQQQPHQHQHQQQTNISMVAKLDHIWVFRATNSINTHNVWITFDYKNQQRIKQHKQMLDRYGVQHDEGVELFDTHIKQGQLPILVLPNRREAYYPISLSGDDIVRIEVACIPNSSVASFVYRQH
ncbi:hypothetical protein BJV82DRAFT_616433 [Fennellomyces sp. T-0311]|nr:hypothetical protein BJV82DRAFT_616433 [Fennellomyces sp. T-0311]